MVAEFRKRQIQGKGAILLPLFPEGASFLPPYRYFPTAIPLPLLPYRDFPTANSLPLFPYRIFLPVAVAYLPIGK